MKPTLTVNKLYCFGEEQSSRLSGKAQRHFFSEQETDCLHIEAVVSNDSNKHEIQDVLTCIIEDHTGIELIKRKQHILIAPNSEETIHFTFDISSFNICLEEIKIYCEGHDDIALHLCKQDAPLDYHKCFKITHFIAVYSEDMSTTSEHIKNYTKFDCSKTENASILLNIDAKQDEHLIQEMELVFSFINEEGEVVDTESVEPNKLEDDSACFYFRYDTPIIAVLDIGTYTIEIDYLGQTIMSVPIAIGHEDKEGNFEVNKYLKNPDIGDIVTPSENHEKTAFNSLQEMIGLQSIKDKINQHFSLIKMLKAREELGLDSKIPPLHMVFTGNPGTGKTTVAELMGEVYRDLGILKKGHVVRTERSKLVGKFLGDTESNTEAAIAQAEGGILFIDEAYNLWVSNQMGEKNDFGNRVIETLLTKLASPDFDCIVVLAGYPTEMNHMLKSNPGLKSRFAYYFEFEDYNVEELLAIAHLHINRMQYKLGDHAENRLKAHIQAAYNHKTVHFGNARFITQLLNSQIIPNMATRVMSSNSYDIDLLTTITDTDIPTFVPDEQKKYTFDEATVSNALKKLDDMVGLEEVKEAIHRIVALARIRIREGKHPLPDVYERWTYTGNTGTGKSTVAQIFTEILFGLGLIDGPQLVQLSGEQVYFTPSHMLDYLFKNVLKQKGANVLFLDSDAAAFQRKYKTLNIEEIQARIANLSIESHAQLVLIVAEHEASTTSSDYTVANNSNAVSHTWHFAQHSAEELHCVAKNFIVEAGFSIDESASTQLACFIRELHKDHPQEANLRGIRELIDNLLEIVYLRLSNNMGEAQDDYTLHILPEDTDALIKNIPSFTTQVQTKIGFK